MSAIDTAAIRRHFDKATRLSDHAARADGESAEMAQRMANTQMATIIKRVLWDLENPERACFYTNPPARS